MKSNVTLMKVQWHLGASSVDLRLRPFSIVGDIGSIRFVLPCHHCA